MDYGIELHIINIRLSTVIYHNLFKYYRPIIHYGRSIQNVINNPITYNLGLYDDITIIMENYYWFCTIINDYYHWLSLIILLPIISHDVKYYLT